MWTSALALWLAFCVPWPEPDPPAEDLVRFPPDAAEWVAFSWQLERHVEVLIAVQPWRGEELRVVLTEIHLCREPWDILAVAEQPCWAWIGGAWRKGSDPDTARYHLARLRELLGEQAYARAELPPPVPYWFFRPLDP